MTIRMCITLQLLRSQRKSLDGVNDAYLLKWLRQCYENWTQSAIQTDAWNYRGDFEGFAQWFIS